MPGILEKLRGFIPCHKGLSWQWLQNEVRSFGDGHTLTVNKVWTEPDAAAFYAQRLKPENWKGGPFAIDSHLVLGEGTLEFCKAVKTLIDDGDLQVLPGGLLQHAVDPVTGYHYQYPEAPKLPGLHVTITPGE